MFSLLEYGLKCRAYLVRPVVIRVDVVCQAVWVVDSMPHSTLSPPLDLIWWWQPDCLSCHRQRLSCAAHAYCLWYLLPDALAMCCAHVSWAWLLTDYRCPEHLPEQRMTPRRTSLRLTESKPPRKSFFVSTSEVLRALTGTNGQGLSKVKFVSISNAGIVAENPQGSPQFPFA
jgi:hypothetical protein